MISIEFLSVMLTYFLYKLNSFLSTKYIFFNSAAKKIIVLYRSIRISKNLYVTKVMLILN